MSNMDTFALECFLAVVETKSFTRAAKRVHRTQSAVSQQIAKLESLIGKTLFFRDKEYTLTSEGEVIHKYAQQIIKLQREAIDYFHEPDITGEVTFGLPEDFASVFLFDLLSEYTLLHPRMSLSVDCDLTVNLFNRFKKNEFDLVLVKMSKPEDFPNGVNIYTEPLVWVGDESHFIDYPNRPIPLVISPPPCVYRASMISALESANLKWRIAFSSHSYAGKIAAVKAGIGVLGLPRNMIPSDINIISQEVSTPKLMDSHVCLLKSEPDNPCVNNLESFILNKLR